MTITILTVGAPPKPEINSLIHSYSKRIASQIKLNWVYIKHKKGDPKSSIKREAESILKALPKKNKIILLDETGEQQTSPQLPQKLFGTQADLTIIIGGAYGVDPSIREKADFTWSLGKLVYPHQLVRLLLSEQIYRAHCINSGHPYHHA